MTDNEIIKAFDEAINLDSIRICVAPSFLDKLCDTKNEYISLATIRDILNRQKANAEGLTNAVKYLNEELTSAKAEIERLQGLLSEWKKEAYKLADSKDEHFKICDEYAEKAKQRYSEMFDEAKGKIKAEAVKEFAERLKEKVESYDVYDGYKITIRFAVEEDTIDKLVKEMAGEG